MCLMSFPKTHRRNTLYKHILMTKGLKLETYTLCLSIHAKIAPLWEILARLYDCHPTKT